MIIQLQYLNVLSQFPKINSEKEEKKGIKNGRRFGNIIINRIEVIIAVVRGGRRWKKEEEREEEEKERKNRKGVIISFIKR